MKRFLKFGWLLAFSVLLFTGCDLLTDSDIDDIRDVIATGSDAQGNSWTICRLVDEDDGLVTESVVYIVWNSEKSWRREFAISKDSKNLFGYSPWSCEMSAIDKIDNSYYTREYSIICENEPVEIKKKDIDFDNECNGLYSCTISGYIDESDIEKLIESSLEDIHIVLKKNSGQDTEIAFNSKFQELVKEYLF